MKDGQSNSVTHVNFTTSYLHAILVLQCSPFVPPVEFVNCPTSLSANDNVCEGSTCECQGFSQAECDAQELRLGSD
jgi:hypothetical protein